MKVSTKNILIRQIPLKMLANTFGGFDLVWFYGMSTIVAYLMPNPLHKYIINIYNLLTDYIDNIFNWA